MDRLKGLLNGTPLPNWVKLIIMGIMLASIYFAQRDAVRQLIEAQNKKVDEQIAAEATQIEGIRDELKEIRQTSNRRNEQLNFELGRISTKLGYVMRKVE